MYGEGISKIGDLLDIAADIDVVKKSGSWYNYNEIKLGQGRENVKKFLQDNMDLVEELETKVRAYYKLDGSEEDTDKNKDVLED
jgi:recombination protein RecA